MECTKERENVVMVCDGYRMTQWWKRMNRNKNSKVLDFKSYKDNKPSFTREEAIRHLSSISSIYLKKFGEEMHKTDRQMLDESIKIVDGYYDYIKWQK